MAGYGAYCVTRDPRNVKISLCKCFTVVNKEKKNSKNKQFTELHVKLSCIEFLALLWFKCYFFLERVIHFSLACRNQELKCVTVCQIRQMIHTKPAGVRYRLAAPPVTRWLPNTSSIVKSS